MKRKTKVFDNMMMIYTINNIDYIVKIDCASIWTANHLKSDEMLGTKALHSFTFSNNIMAILNMNMKSLPWNAQLTR